MTKTLSDGQRLVLVALAFAIIIAAAIWATVAFIPGRRVNGMLQGHWFRFGVMTLFTCAALLRAYWEARKLFWFWIVFLGFVVAHCFAFGLLWSTFHGLPTLILAFLASGEWILMAFLLYWTTRVEPNLRPWRSRSRWVPTL
jgi:hypothetical protein